MTMPGPRGLTKETGARTDSPSDLRSGTVVAVTQRGVTVAVAEGLVEGAAHLGSYSPAVGDPVSMIRFADTWLVLGRPVGPGTATDFATPGSAAGTTLLDGCGLSGTGAIMVTSTGATVTVPRYGVTFHHPTNHWVMLLCGMTWYSTVADDWVRVALINEAGVVTVGSVNLHQVSAASQGFETWAAMVPPSFGGKEGSYYMSLQRTSGTGTSRIEDVAARRGFLMALDMGDQSVIRTV